MVKSATDGSTVVVRGAVGDTIILVPIVRVVPSNVTFDCPANVPDPLAVSTNPALLFVNVERSPVAPAGPVLETLPSIP